MKRGILILARPQPAKVRLRALALLSASALLLGGCDAVTNYMSRFTPDKIAQALGTEAPPPANDTGDASATDQSGYDASHPVQPDQTSPAAPSQTPAELQTDVRSLMQQQRIKNSLAGDQANARYVQAQVNGAADPTQPINPINPVYAPVTPSYAPQIVASAQPSGRITSVLPPAPAGSATLSNTYQQRLAEFAGAGLPAAAPAGQAQVDDSGAMSIPANSDATFAGTMVQPLTDIGGSIQVAKGVKPLDQAGIRRGSRFEVAAIDFDSGATILSDSDKAQLQGVATLAKQKGSSVQVVGNRFGGATPIGDLVDLQLAAARAAVVANALVSLGVAPNRIYAGPGLDDGGVTLADAATNVFVAN